MLFEFFRYLVMGLFWVFLDFLYWVKFAASAIVLWHKKRTRRRRFDLYDFEVEDQPEKVGIIVPQEEVILESPLPEEKLEKFSDEIFMYGFSSKSESLVVRILRNPNSESEAWIYLRLSDGRLFYLDKTSGYQSNSEGKTTDFTCGGLKIYPLCPMRRWRISYSGMLREKKHGDGKQLGFVKFTFIWTASSDVYDPTSDFSIKATAEAMAKEKWTSFIPPIEKLESTFNSYCQSGVINGVVSIENEPDHEMYLFGERIKYLGESSYLEGSNFKQILGVIPQTGFFIHLRKMSVPHLIKNLHSGFIVNPSSKIDIIGDGQIISKSFGSERTSQQISAMFKTESFYELRGNTIGEPMRLKTDQSYEGNIEMSEIKFKIDGYNGYGFMFSGEIFKVPQKVRNGKRYKTACLSKKNRPLAVSFTEEESHLVELAGGKGSSLGKLTELSNEMKSEFVVPKGVVITTEAYNMFLADDHKITEKIEKMKNIAYGNTEGNIHEACEEVQKAVVDSGFKEPLFGEIVSKLLSVFPDNPEEIKFAVRSSATGEDTEQMSAAGQMDTYLGVQRLNEILMAMKKCWASQFSFRAIEYKRQNGQILDLPMAVVIQQMVECDTSGVLFTCDPVTNNPSVVVITSNYGLGESVVSGSEEPDTIILQKVSDDDVTIKDVIIGMKQRKIIVNDSDLPQRYSTGTVVQDVPEDEQKKCCISEETTINLGKLSLKIENYYKSLRDIEWGIKDNKIFILQSRPITTGEITSDYEIMHEFDGPLRNEDDFFTTCNVGEVMPNAMSPLGFEVINKGFGIIFMKDYRKKMARNYYQQSKYYPTGMLPFYNHLFLSAIDLLTFWSTDLDSMDTKGMMISIFGRILNDPELKEKIKERNYPELNNKLKLMIYFFWSLFLPRYGMNALKEKVFKYQIPSLKGKKSEEIFSFLLKFCTHSSKPFERHMDCSGSSSAWNMYLFSVLANAKEDIDNDVYSDFAKLLASASNVESADVPAAMKVLAHSITKEIDIKKFTNMSVEEIQEWLESSQTEAGKKYRNFIERHGHRCLNEMDVYSKPWYMDPKPLIALLQGMTGISGDNKPKEEADLSEVLPHLKIRLNLKSKLLLKFLVPRCRSAIRGREIGKTTVVKCFDNIRKGFRHLSKALVAEGYLPDAELMFFLTLDEIKNLLETRSPRLISRAKHRRKLLPLMDTFKFPEISKGRPVPISQDSDQDKEYEANLTMKGIPVSQGTVKGYARVALSIKDAAELKPGEILITHSTDIGWSPYFSILGGVVTEIGGLISHGAVVSREYGLPCVVGLHEATRLFKTGDFVLLDGNKGILQRLSQEETK